MSGVALDLPSPEGRIALAMAESSMQAFNVNGVACGHCVRALTEVVCGVDPAAASKMDLKTGKVAVQDGKTPASRIWNAIAAAGYSTE